MVQQRTKYLALVFLALMPLMTSSFTVKGTTVLSIASKSSLYRKVQQSPSRRNPASFLFHVSCSPPKSASRVILQMTPDKKERLKVYEESEKRGNVLFAFVLLVCIWSFSIPPELRREHFCFSERCRSDNTANLCYDCITFSEWRGKVADYYKGGGGVKFDFSVEE